MTRTAYKKCLERFSKEDRKNRARICNFFDAIGCMNKDGAISTSKTCRRKIRATRRMCSGKSRHYKSYYPKG